MYPRTRCPRVTCHVHSPPRPLQVLRPFMLRRTKAEVAKELPAKHEHMLRCALSPWQKKLYSHMRDQGSLTVRPTSSIL